MCRYNYLWIVIFTILFHSSGEVVSQSFYGAYEKANGNIIAINPMHDCKDVRLIELETGTRQTLTYATENRYITTVKETPVLYQFIPGDNGCFTLEAKGQTGSWSAKKIPLREHYITFKSGDIMLHGKLVLPVKEGKYPVVVLASGSDYTPAVEFFEEAYFFPAKGIACFVYDKRGTGASGGEPILSFPILSDDLVAAVKTISGFPEVDNTKIGLSGYSQGGWIAPLAASKTNLVRYVVVNYGMTMSIADEDWHEAPLKLRDKGISDSVSLSEFQDLNAALHMEVKNDFSTGWYERLEDKIKQYEGRPWLDTLKTLNQTWSGAYLNMDYETQTQVVPGMMRTIQPFYDPVVTLKKLNIPMLWLLGEEDIEAPPEITIRTIEQFQKEGKPFDLKVYPDADHGILLYEKKGNVRVYTNVAETYYADIITWIETQTER